MMITLEQAVQTTMKLVDFSNSQKGIDFFDMLSKKLGINIKKNFHVYVNTITDICPDCTNCKGNECEVGCLIEPDFRICYTKTGLDLLGDRLIVHEMGHLWFTQVFDTSQMSQNDYMQNSEIFALYVEKNYTNTLISDIQSINVTTLHKTTSLLPLAVSASVVSVAALVIYVILKKKS